MLVCYIPFNESNIFARGKYHFLFLPFEQALYKYEPAVIAKVLSHLSCMLYQLP